MTFTEQQQILHKEFLKYYAGDTDSAKAFIEWCKYEMADVSKPNVAQVGGNQADKLIEQLDKIVDSYSIHQPQGRAKGTLARQRMKNKLHKTVQWHTKTSAITDPNTPTRPVGATEEYPHTANRRVTCLTGQQWLKRFKEQCDILEPNTPDQVWKAARIAACLEDDENA